MNIEAPERYFNQQDGNRLIAALLGLSSSVMCGLNLFGYTNINVWIALAPITFVFVRRWSYRFLVNAIHEALRRAELDSSIDDMDVAALTQQRSPVLDAGVFSDTVRG